MTPGMIRNQNGYGPDRFLPCFGRPPAAGARRVASELLNVLAMAKPFREVLPPAPGGTDGRTVDVD